MSDDTEFTEEGRLLAGMLQDILITSSALEVMMRARCNAVLEALPTTQRRGDASPPTPEAVREFVSRRTKALADTYLAEVADEDMAKASVVKRLIDTAFPE